MNYPRPTLAHPKPILIKRPSFSERMEQEFTVGSAIAPDLYRAAIDFVEDMGFWEPNELLGQHVATQYQTRRPHNYGALAVFRNEDGSLWQAKPENPRIGKKGTAQKYESLKDKGARAYTPPISTVTRQKISQRYGVAFPSDGSFWKFVEQHPEIPIVLTEGGKKSLCLLGFGHVAISLFGVDGGVLKSDTIAGEKVLKLKPVLIPDLAPFAQPDRQWVLAFDQDAALKTRLKVERAIGDLAFHLEQTGGIVRVASWDAQNGLCKGVDDLIAHAGSAAWETALEQAQPAEEWRISRRLAQAVRRKPDLNIGDREFKEAVDSYPQTGNVAFHGAKGTAKSEAIRDLIGDRSYLSFTALQSVARDQAATFPHGVFVNDADRYGQRLLAADGSEAQGASVCIPSVLKVAGTHAQVIVLDETSDDLSFLLQSKLANKNGERFLLIEAVERALREAELVITADADITEDVLLWVERVTGKPVFLVRSERQPLKYRAHNIEGTQPEAIAELLQRVESLPDGQLVYVNTDSKRLAQQLADLLGKDKTLLITSDTSGGETESSFLTSKGGDIPQLLQQRIRFIISSPSVVQGFSITQHTDRIDSVWGFYQGCSITANAMAQGLDRVRSAEVPRFLHVAKRGRAYSSLSQAQTTTAFLKEFQAASTATARLVRDALTPRAEQQVDGVDWQGDRHLQMLASLEVNRNQGMAALRPTVLALLKQEGKEVRPWVPTVSKAQTAAVKGLLKASGKQLEEARCQAVAAAADITPEQAAAWSEGTAALTPDQLLSLEKHYLGEFYRLETVGVVEVAFDKSGRTRQQIRRLEQVLNPALATESTASSINKSGVCPQDWKRDRLRLELLENCGMGALIRLVVSGDRSSYDASEADIQAIAESCRQHPKEFRIAFGFRDVARMPVLQIIGTFFEWVGLTRQRHRTRVGGQILSHYRIVQDRLSALLAIVQRRQKADPHPLKENITKGCGSAASPDEWLSDEAELANIRAMWADADSEEEREGVKAVIPGYVLEHLGIAA